MSLIRLDTGASSYEDINGGAHRQAASIIGIPALVRHLGFWSTGIAGERDQIDELLGGNTRAALFESYVKALITEVSDNKSGVVDFDGDRDVYHSDSAVRSGRISVVSFWWHGIRAAVRIEYHGEYVTLTAILDLSVRPREYVSKVRKDNHQTHLRIIFKKLKSLFDKRIVESKSFPRIAFLQNVIWRDFESQVLSVTRTREVTVESAFGPVFADFRGMITGSTVTDLTHAARSNAGSEHVFCEAFACDLDRRRSGYIGDVPPTDEWRAESLQRLWPLIESEPYLRDFEFTASGFLAGRVVYVSALGPKPREPLDTGWPWTPVYYFMHAAIADPWQIGRLVNRLHTCGIFRLAATIGINILSKAGASVDQLTAAVNAASESIQSELQQLGLRTECSTVDPAGGAQTGAQRSFATASAGAETLPPDAAMIRMEESFRGIDSLFRRGFLHRLERAQYYIERFEKEVRGLRALRIEGFQRYDEFVLRRMGGVFGYIRLLRRRMNDIDGRKRNLIGSYAAFKTAEVTCRIDTLVLSMTKQDNEIKKIQDFGEAALIGFLIPYYAGTMLISNVMHLQDGSEPHWLWPAMMSAFAGVVLLRRHASSEDDAAERKRVARRRALFACYILTIWICFGLSLSAHSDDASGARAPAAASDPEGGRKPISRH